MGYTKQIVCLANSWKHRGRCIAGKEVRGGRYGSWVRPVSERPGGELTNAEIACEDKSDPVLMDILRVQLQRAAPHDHQKENHIIDGVQSLKRVGRVNWAELPKLADEPAELWDNTSSSYYGRLDRVHVENAKGLSGSLFLIRPNSLTVHVREEGQEFGNARVKIRGEFEYGRTTYRLSITDPVAVTKCEEKGLGSYPIRDCYLCISLGECYSDDYCYKLVATRHHTETR